MFFIKLFWISPVGAFLNLSKKSNAQYPVLLTYFGRYVVTDGKLNIKTSI